MKKCTKCGEWKPLDAFYRMPEMRDGHRNDCKACNLAAKAARYRANPLPARQRTREWRLANPEKYAAAQARFRQSGGRKAANRRSHLKRKFGITPEQYEEMLAAQRGGCAICSGEPRRDISLHVDHDHSTGRIRGLLCFRCNNSLGDLDDSTELLRAAVAYLERPAVEADRPLVLARLAKLSGR